jgi:hypothetical protein
MQNNPIPNISITSSGQQNILGSQLTNENGDFSFTFLYSNADDFTISCKGFFFEESIDNNYTRYTFENITAQNHKLLIALTLVS